jgi:hypothetical protein
VGWRRPQELKDTGVLAAPGCRYTARQPHIPARCLVELVRADATKERPAPQPGLVAQQDGVTVTVFAFDVAGDRIKHIWVVRNPEKLRS